MSLYQCEKCGCKENTACGFYWCSNLGSVPEKHKGKKLCSACAPKIMDFNGKWHGEFDRQYFEIGSCYTDSDGNLRIKNTNEYATYANALKVEKK